MFFRNELYTPCGAGREQSNTCARSALFQSTRPVRGGTDRFDKKRLLVPISIHPPRAGRDSNKSQNCFCNLLHNIQ